MNQRRKDWWHLCDKCGKEEYPNYKPQGGAITVMLGTCPRCGAKDKVLKPIADYEGRGD